MFDLLASADLMVARAAPVATRLQTALGVLVPRGTWLQEWPDWGFEAHWCRVARRIDRAPTHIEIIAPDGTPDPDVNHPYMAEMYAAQAPRRYRTHSTPVAVADLDVVLGRLDAAGAPYRLDEPAEKLPFRRLWLGRSDVPGAYDPAADGGLYLELLETESMGFPILTAPVEPVATPGDGLVRVEARMMLVEDVHATLDLLARTLGWEPAAAPVLDRGARRARLGFTHVHSAALELVEPIDPDSAEAGYLRRWGPGPYGIRLEVDDLDASLQRLKAHDIAATTVSSEDGPMVLPGADDLFGVQFELIGARP